jgi:hypothetical protein
LGTYQQVDSDLNGYSSQGGLKSSYYSGKRLAYAELLVLGETGKELLTFYVVTPDVALVKEEGYLYEKSIYDEPKPTIRDKTSSQYLVRKSEVFLVSVDELTPVQDEGKVKLLLDLRKSLVDR